MNCTQDFISISRLRVNCIVGCNPEEREKTQDLYISLEMQVDCAKAGSSDNLEDTVNYDGLTREIASAVVEARCFLIERVAELVAKICLARDKVEGVTVIIEKPEAVSGADCATVRITRRKEQYYE